jgi:hypothetical protein
MMVRAYNEGRDPGLLLHQVLEFLNSPEHLAFTRMLTGENRIRRVSAQATRYRAGHFLRRHNDSSESDQRLYAYVMNLSRDWQADWGGQLQFLDPEGRVLETFLPVWKLALVVQGAGRPPRHPGGGLGRAGPLLDHRVVPGVSQVYRLQAAARLLERRLFAEARAECEHVIGAEPRNADAWNLLGHDRVPVRRLARRAGRARAGSRGQAGLRQRLAEPRRRPRRARRPQGRDRGRAAPARVQLERAAGRLVQPRRARVPAGARAPRRGLLRAVPGARAPTHREALNKPRRGLRCGRASSTRHATPPRVC